MLSLRFGSEVFPMSPLLQEVSRYFDSAPSRQPTPRDSAPEFRTREVEDRFELSADLPGFTEKDVTLDIDDGVLSLSGARSVESVSDVAFTRRERELKKFSRRLRLPPEVDSTAVTAKVTNGVLTVSLPKREETKPRRVSVTVN